MIDFGLLFFGYSYIFLMSVFIEKLDKVQSKTRPSQNCDKSRAQIIHHFFYHRSSRSLSTLRCFIIRNVPFHPIPTTSLRAAKSTVTNFDWLSNDPAAPKMYATRDQGAFFSSRGWDKKITSHQFTLVYCLASYIEKLLLFTPSRASSLCPLSAQ